MRLGEVRDLLEAQTLAGAAIDGLDVDNAFGSDLMSDVLAFTHGNTLLLTGLSNPQVIRTAEIAGIPAIVFVRGKTPPDETIALAGERDIPLMRTDLTMFEACGRLFAAGLRSCDIHRETREEGLKHGG